MSSAAKFSGQCPPSPTADGSDAAPFSTLTEALRQATPGTVVQLSVGTYSVASGEQFPLVVPAGVILLGNESTKGQGITIQGGGSYDSPTLGQQNVAILLGKDAQARGISVINSDDKGTGIWLESSNALVQNCTIASCGREGILATGNANPLIRDNVLKQNRISGLSMLRSSKGEVWGNTLEGSTIGLALGDQSAPLVARNRLNQNRTGIIVAGTASPVLRGNTIQNSAEIGLSLKEQALPDFGDPQSPAGNIFQNSTQFDLNVETGKTLVSVGNQVDPRKNRGPVSLQASELTQAIASPSPSRCPCPPGVSGGNSSGGNSSGEDNSGGNTSGNAGGSLPVSGGPVSGGPLVFADIRDHWAGAFIQALVDRKILSGFPDGTFRPQTSLTRVEYAALVAKAFNRPLIRPGTTFPDLPTTFWGNAAIAKASRMAFIAGFPDGTFRPNQQLTRVQGIVSLVSGLGLSGGSPGLLGVYGDRAQIPSYATNAIATATQNRIIVNHPQLNLLNPLRPTTRAEIAVMVYQALVVLRQAPVIESAFIPQPIVPTSLTDLNGHWAEPFVRSLVDQNLLTGFPDGSFHPNAAVSRAEYAVMIAKAFAPQRAAPKSTFKICPPISGQRLPSPKRPEAVFWREFPPSGSSPISPFLGFRCSFPWSMACS
ncbi:MAG: DUF1565 domain-containing protein [Synechococcales cyanobacterium RU_4_20]|nr:DUF1565 domain-containing protein [Synechococcales cyanobacterium RU_4_20]